MVSISKLLSQKVMGMNIPPSLKMLLFGVYNERLSYRPCKCKSRALVRKKVENGQLDYEELGSIIDYWFDSPDNLKYDCSVDDLASNLRVSRRRILNYFQNILKKDYRSYKIEKKIAMAKDILLDDAYVQVARVADRLGFKDKSNFHRQFKKHVGCTPCQWRNSGGHPECDY